MDEVRVEVTKYFKEHFLERVEYMPTIDGISFSGFSVEDVESISTRFDHFEVDRVVTRMDVCKSSRPYEFNFEFYRKFQELLKEEMYIMFNEIYENEVLSRSF